MELGPAAGRRSSGRAARGFLQRGHWKVDCDTSPRGDTCDHTHPSAAGEHQPSLQAPAPWGERRADSRCPPWCGAGRRAGSSPRARPGCRVPAVVREGLRTRGRPLQVHAGRALPCPRPRPPVPGASGLAPSPAPASHESWGRQRGRGRGREGPRGEEHPQFHPYPLALPGPSRPSTQVLEGCAPWNRLCLCPELSSASPLAASCASRDGTRLGVYLGGWCRRLGGDLYLQTGVD